MRNLITKLTVVSVLAICVFSIQAQSQETPKQGVHGRSQGTDELEGCYQVTLLSWSPPDLITRQILKRFELLSVPWRPGAARFGIRSLEVERDPLADVWTWRPKGRQKLEINWGSGLGGYRGTLKRSARGELTGTLREYCDSRCAFKRSTGSFHLRKIECESN